MAKKRRQFSFPHLILAAILIGCLIGLVIPSPSGVEKHQTAFKRSLFHETLQSQTVMVLTERGEGSGVVVKRGDKTFVWTAAHVVDKFSQVEVRQQFRFNGQKAGHQSFPAYVIARLPDTDAALLWVDAPPDKLTGAEWAVEGAGPGTPVLCVGNILGHNFDGSVSEGVVAQIGVAPEDLFAQGWPWSLVDQATVVSWPGSSGGPVFNTDGQIVGLIVGGPGRAGVACYVPLRVIYAAAQEASVTWALYGSLAPSAKLLEEAVVNSTQPEEKLDDILIKILGGGSTSPTNPPVPVKPPVKPIKSPKDR